MILSEEGADFVSKEVASADKKTNQHGRMPVGGWRQGAHADCEARIVGAIPTGLAGDDADIVIARLEVRDGGDPSAILALLDRVWPHSAPARAEFGLGQFLRHDQALLEWICHGISSTLHPLFLNRELRVRGAMVVPEDSGCGGLPVWSECGADIIG